MALTTHILRTDSDVVKTEGPNRLSRDEIVLEQGHGVLEPGVVLGQVTVSGKFAPLAPAASDGSQRASKVLLQHADTRSVEVKAVALARHAEIVRLALVWPAGITTEQKSAALTALEWRRIVAREAA